MDAQITSDHPIIFILDATNTEVEVPEIVGGQLIAQSSSCVSVGIQAYVDGETSVHITSALDKARHQKLERVFSGRINAPGQTLAVVSADFKTIVASKTRTNCAAFDIWVDDGVSPSIVMIVLTL